MVALARKKSTPVSGRSRSMSSFCGTYPSRVSGLQRKGPRCGSAPMSAWKSTVFPAPFGPMMAMAPPDGT